MERNLLRRWFTFLMIYYLYKFNSSPDRLNEILTEFLKIVPHFPPQSLKSTVSYFI